MEYAEIVKKVQAIIVDKLGVEPSEVTETANFTNDLDCKGRLRQGRREARLILNRNTPIRRTAEESFSFFVYLRV